MAFDNIDNEYFEEDEPLDLSKFSLAELLDLSKQKKNINSKAIPGVTSEILREQLMSHAPAMVNTLQEMFHNGAVMSNPQREAYDKLWPLIEKVILSAGDTQKIDATNASEIMKLVSEGKMSIEKGLSYMALVQKQVELEELPKLFEVLSSLDDK